MSSDSCWERAMERLGLGKDCDYAVTGVFTGAGEDCDYAVTGQGLGKDCDYAVTGVFTGANIRHEYPDPDDPTTFLRVVEALLERNVRITLYPKPHEVLLAKANPNGLYICADTLYEAVMEAFGEE